MLVPVEGETLDISNRDKPSAETCITLVGKTSQYLVCGVLY